MKKRGCIVGEHEAHEGVQKFGVGLFPDGVPGCNGVPSV
jgi:hypothetical protein